VFEPVGRTATKLLPALSKNLPLATFLNESPLPPLPTKGKLKDLFFIFFNFGIDIRCGYDIIIVRNPYTIPD